jgi:hypothetical protein
LFLLLILPILTSGFHLCQKSPFYKFKLHRYEGQFLYLKCAKQGFFCFCVGAALLMIFSFFDAPKICGVSLSVVFWIKSFFTEIYPKDVDAELIVSLSYLSILSILTHIVAFVIIFIQLLRFKWLSFTERVPIDILLMYDILSDSPLDNKLFQSYARSEPLLISLSNNKIYVGIVNWLGEPNEIEGMDQEISIVPILSGYRDSKDKTVVFTTNYKYVANLDNPQVIIRQELIDTVSDFDIDVYAELAKQKKKQPISNYIINIENPSIRIKS